jgi:hypothetical protein
MLEEEDVDDGDIEEEEEGEGVLDYEDDALPREVDLKKLNKTQKRELELNYQRLLFLKALSINCYQDFIKLGRKVGFTKDAMSQELVQMVMGMISHEFDKPDYPAKIIRYFNRLLPDNYPRKEEVTLDEYDINELANLYKVHEDMAHGRAITVDPDKLYGENVLDNLEKGKEINQAMVQQKTVMDSNYQQQPQNPSQQQQGQAPPSPQVDNGQGFIPQAPRNNKEFFLGKYDNQDIGLMEYALRSIFNPRPNFVPGFINNFIDLYSNWINNPAKIQEQLIYSFGDKAGSQAYLLWRDLREDLKRNVGGGGSLYSSSNSNRSMSFTGDLDADYQRELIQERRQEKRMKQLMDMMQMKFMETAMQAQTPTLPGAIGSGNFEEVLDHNGKVIKRIYMNNNNGGGNSGGVAENGMITALSGIFNNMLQGANAEKIELLKKVSSPDTTWQTLAQSMLNNHLNQQNPAAIANQLIEVANVLRPNNGNNDISKSIEATKLEVDTKIAMKELELKHAELQHNWRMDERQSQEQDSNVDKWLTMLQSVSTDLIKPVALKFVEGFGKGGMGNNPLGAMFGQQQPQQPPQPSEQEIAEAQQRYYMNQQAAQHQQSVEPPLEPMGPPPSRSRGYNPAQPPGSGAQQQQRPPPQRGGGNQQLDEQQLQQQLQQMQPEQLEELHDQLEMEDMKRERAKNMIKAVMNAKRSRPMTAGPPPPHTQQQQQQQVFDEESIRKAQETLNFGNTNAEEEEEEEEYDEEQDYDVPIAAGQDRDKKTSKRNAINTYGDTEYDTSDLNHKKLNRQERALLAQGEISPSDLEGIEEQDASDEEENSVPIAGIYNASDEEKKKKPRATKKTVTKKKEEVKEGDSSNEVIAEAEELIEEVETIPADDI